MGVLIHNGINYTGGGGGIPALQITRAQYQAQKAYYDGLDALIIITDDNTVITASGITFDNTGTGMVATNVQGAITELNSKLVDKSKIISFPDYSNIIARGDGVNYPWTATANCWIIGDLRAVGSLGLAQITVENQVVAKIYNSGNEFWGSVCAPVMAGQTVRQTNTQTDIFYIIGCQN